MGNSQCGKGDTYRKVDRKKYRENYDRIFKKKEEAENGGKKRPKTTRP